MTLDEMVVDKFGTQQNCANKLNWSRQKLNNIVRGKQMNVSVKDAEDLAQALDISLDLVAQKILQAQSTKL